MKKLMTALIVAAAVTFGFTAKAEKPVKKPAANAEKMQKECDKFMAVLKTMDEAKYNEVNAITDAKAKLTAAKTAVINGKLAELQKTDEAKYKSLMALKTANLKEYNKEVSKLLGKSAPGAAKAKKAAKPAADVNQ